MYVVNGRIQRIRRVDDVVVVVVVVPICITKQVSLKYTCILLPRTIPATVYRMKFDLLLARRERVRI